MVLSIQEIIGRFHPLLVHLPIGILLFAALLHVISRKEKFVALQPAVRVALFWGMLSAVASCISGFILSGLDEYDETLVAKHQWFAIATAFVSLCAYFLSRKNDKLLNWLVLLMVLLIIITGHLGGSLTHGSDYLTKAFSNTEEKLVVAKPIPNAQEAFVYSDIVQPLLQSKCYTCHGANKRKGGLRLDEPDFILKGGKDGKVVEPGSAEESDMIRRLMLPRNDEYHMPPKEKSQLKESEISLIHWWITNGASFDKKAKELEQPEKIKPILLALQKEEKKILPDVPLAEVEKANDEAIQKLKQKGVVVVPVSQNSNYLSVNFISVDSLTDTELEWLLPLKKQLIWLKISGKKITDKGLKTIGQLESLIRLQIDNTLISDKGLLALESLSELQYLNLAGTKVSAQGILQLKGLQKLQTIYVYSTEFKSADLFKVQSAFPKTRIDTGGYTVPFVADDTTELKAARPLKINN